MDAHKTRKKIEISKENKHTKIQTPRKVQTYMYNSTIHVDSTLLSMTVTKDTFFSYSGLFCFFQKLPCKGGGGRGENKKQNNIWREGGGKKQQGEANAPSTSSPKNPGLFSISNVEKERWTCDEISEMLTDDTACSDYCQQLGGHVTTQGEMSDICHTRGRLVASHTGVP